MSWELFAGNALGWELGTATLGPLLQEKLW